VRLFTALGLVSLSEWSVNTLRTVLILGFRRKLYDDILMVWSACRRDRSIMANQRFGLRMERRGSSRRMPFETAYKRTATRNISRLSGMDTRVSEVSPCPLRFLRMPRLSMVSSA